ncbi:MAG: metal-sensitive transcriptional regulator [Clostridium sp.]|nr:metal-sensitive transcriptional regulator [Clostridium sp.]
MDDNKKYINRLKRSEGQLRGIIKMMENERSCSDVVTQLSAVRASIDKLITLIVTDNLMECVAGDESKVDSSEMSREEIEKAIKLIFSSR